MAHIFIYNGKLHTLYRGQEEHEHYWETRARFVMDHASCPDVEQLSYIHTNKLFYKTTYGPEMMKKLQECLDG